VNAQNARLTVFISDTHFGVGKQDGQWHPYEDARWASEFALFLDAISEQGRGATDLVLNGDTFELWQSLGNDCVYPDEDLGCTEAEALGRLKVVLAAHAEEMGALRKFAVSGENTIAIVPGNHDAALAFPSVAAEVVRAIGAPAGRVRIVDGYWVSNDGMVFAELGQQIGRDLNKFSEWPRPFVVKKGVTYLRRPWGEAFVHDFYNQFETKYPIIDNLAEESLSIKYARAAEGKLGTTKALGRYVTFYLTQTSVAQLTQRLGDQRGPNWDVAAMRATGNRFFVESLPSDDPVRQLAEEALKEGTLGVSVSDLSDDEIRGICSWRAAILKEDATLKRPPRLTPCRQKGLGSNAEALLRSRDSIFREHLKETSQRLRREGGTRTPFALFVFSHTHLAEASYAPFAGNSSSWKPLVMNTGAWQRTISEAQINKYMREKNLQPAEVLKLRPEDLPPCYPVVFVPAYATVPQGILRYWRLEDGVWSMAERCE
jgi:hypothetical protein